MKAPGIRPPIAPAPRAAGSTAVLSAGEVSTLSRRDPLALTAAQDHLHALQALQAILPSQEFWSPKVIGQIPEEVVGAFLDAMVARKPAQRQRLAIARSVRELPGVQRMLTFFSTIESAPPDESLRRGLAWAAGLPLDILSKEIVKPLEEGQTSPSLDLGRGNKALWLPDKLHIDLLHIEQGAMEALPDDLVVEGTVRLWGCAEIRELPNGFRPAGLSLTSSGIRRLPENLRISHLRIDNCSSLESLPKGLQVDYLHLRGGNICRLPPDLVVKERLITMDSPLEFLSNDEIRSMAPGVTGWIN